MKLTEVAKQSATFSEEASEWLTANKITKWIPTAGESIVITQHVKITKPVPNGKIPVKIFSVVGDFSARDVGLVTLENFPTRVVGKFEIDDNKNLKTLEHGPQIVVGEFSCSGTGISSFEHAPKDIGGSTRAYSCNFTNLHNIHKQIKKLSGILNLENNHIKSHVLGLLMIKGLRRVNFMSHLAGSKLSEAEVILNKYLKLDVSDRDIIKIQEEIIQAGLGEYAKL